MAVSKDSHASGKNQAVGQHRYCHRFDILWHGILPPLNQSVCLYSAQESKCASGADSRDNIGVVSGGLYDGYHICAQYRVNKYGLIGLLKCQQICLLADIM